ncbi:MAG: alpha/beta fold hydrolase [Cyanophyceae cyanobacterium]
MPDSFKITSVGAQPSVKDPRANRRNGRLRLPQGQWFWKEDGRGAPVVFLHGMPGDSSQWDYVLDSVMERHHDDLHCFVPDLLGCGESLSAVGSSITIQRDALLAYLNALDLQQVWLVGTSVGAWVGCDLAIAHPHRVTGLVLLDPDGAILPKPLQRQRRRQYRWGRRSLRRQWLGLAKRFSRRATARWHQVQYLRSHGDQFKLWDRLLIKRPKAERQGEWLSGKLEGVKQPVLLMRSANPDPISGHNYQHFSRAIAQAKHQPLDALPDSLSATYINSNPNSIPLIDPVNNPPEASAEIARHLTQFILSPRDTDAPTTATL